MGSDTLVNAPIDEGRTVLTRLEAAGVEIAVAAWVRSTDDGEWLLFIVSPSVVRDGRGITTEKLVRACRSFNATWVTTSIVRLLKPDDIRAQPLLRLRNRPSGRALHIIAPASLGNHEISELYIYPERLRHELTEADKQVLAGLYSRANVPTDQLAYSPEMDALHRDFVEQTKLPITVGDLYRALMRLRKQAKLPRLSQTGSSDTQTLIEDSSDGAHAPSGTAGSI